MRDTIFALVTAPGRAAVAVIRVSGPLAGDILRHICGRMPKARTAALRKISSIDGEVIDEGIVLWFPTPKSFTGEDVFELQLHGGQAIIAKTIDTLATLGARLAEPGEFTRRAFEAGRLDLAQAEAVADLVDAETDAQRRQALRQLNGELGVRSNLWRRTLVDALAHLGAQIDFPDDELPDEISKQTRVTIEVLAAEIREALGEVRGERVRDGLKIALIGAPNAGKSSLFNKLIGRDAAIVADIPGTTRDIIEASVMMQGYKVLIADTAGLRDADNAVEVEGVRRARDWAVSADLRLLVIDQRQIFDPADVLDIVSHGDILVLAKSDLGAAEKSYWADLADRFNLSIIESSTVAIEGVVTLTSFLETWVVRKFSGGDFPAVTRARHRVILVAALEQLEICLATASTGLELVAEQIRLAARSLENITGRVSPEDVLDRVFSKFCIGK